jgi:HlyD family secretion protein
MSWTVASVLKAAVPAAAPARPSPDAFGVALPVEPDWRPTARLGLVVFLVFFAGFGGWASLAPLHSATVAPGEIRAEGERRTVQHLEGGIIREFLVREGQSVRAGQVLIRLDDSQAGANADLAASQVDTYRAVEARLAAEAADEARITFPSELAARRSQARVAETLTAQETLFANRRAALQQQVAVLQARIEQSRADIRSYQAQQASSVRQLQLTQDELGTVEQLFRQGYERRPRLLDLQRRAAELQGNRDQQQEMMARAQRVIAEAEAQIAALSSDRRRDIANDRSDNQARLTEAEERQRSTLDIRRRLDVAAPVAGVVANMHFFTVGAVIRPGDAIVDIVPVNEALVVEAQINPDDVESVTPGMRAEVRITGLRWRIRPSLLGEVTYVSADVSLNERTNTSYYKATIRIPPDQLRTLEGATLQPGMPTEVFILGNRRSMVGYLTQPIRETFGRAFRER